jgi:hypothetical protein
MCVALLMRKVPRASDHVMALDPLMRQIAHAVVALMAQYDVHEVHLYDRQGASPLYLLFASTVVGVWKQHAAALVSLMTRLFDFDASPTSLSSSSSSFECTWTSEQGLSRVCVVRCISEADGKPWMRSLASQIDPNLSDPELHQRIQGSSLRYCRLLLH